MEAIIQIILRREESEQTFVERLVATVMTLRVSGARRIRFLQLGGGSVLVMAYREATAEEETQS